MTDPTSCFVVTAYRWGDNERHSYVVAVLPTLDAALAVKSEEESWRGGKYSCGIVEWDADRAYYAGYVPNWVVAPGRNPDIAYSGAARRDELSDALLWYWAAEHHVHERSWEGCDDENSDNRGPLNIPCRQCAEIADMRNAAADRVRELLDAEGGAESPPTATGGDRPESIELTEDTGFYTSTHAREWDEGLARLLDELCEVELGKRGLL